MGKRFWPWNVDLRVRGVRKARANAARFRFVPTFEVLEDRVQPSLFVPFFTATADSALLATGVPVQAMIGTPLDGVTVANFSDRANQGQGLPGSYAASIDWGDGSTSAGTIASTLPVSVRIYNGYQTTGGGAPFSGLVGTFDASDALFASHNLSEGIPAWHPFGVYGYGADIVGNLDVASTGEYNFQLGSDDGSLLFIDGALVIDNGNPHTFLTVGQIHTLTAGLHSFEVQFFANPSDPSGVDLTLPAGVSYAQTYAVTGSHTYAEASVVDPTVTISSLDHFDITGNAYPVTGNPVVYGVTARDQYGHVLDDFCGTVAVTSTDPAAVVPSTITFSAGAANLPVTFMTAGPQTLSLDLSERGVHSELGVSVIVGPSIDGESTVLAGDVYTLHLSPGSLPPSLITSWTICWGDAGELTETFAGNPSTVTHVYQDYPNAHLIQASANLGETVYVAGNKVLVNVLVPTIDSADSVAIPGFVPRADLATPDGSASVTVLRTAPGQPNTFLVVFLAHYGDDPQLGTDPNVKSIGGVTFTNTDDNLEIHRTAYDLRISAFLDTGRTLVPIPVKDVALFVTFAIPQPDHNPSLEFVDPADGQTKAIFGSTRYPNSYVRVGNTFQIIFDDTSFPTLAQLRGTIFTISDTQSLAPALLNLFLANLPNTPSPEQSLNDLLSADSLPDAPSSYLGVVTPSQIQTGSGAGGSNPELDAWQQQFLDALQSILQRTRRFVAPMLHLETDLLFAPALDAPPSDKPADGDSLHDQVTVQASDDASPIPSDQPADTTSPPPETMSDMPTPAPARPATGWLHLLREKSLAGLALIAIPLYPSVAGLFDLEPRRSPKRRRPSRD